MAILIPPHKWDLNEHKYDEILHALLEMKLGTTLSDDIIVGNKAIITQLANSTLQGAVNQSRVSRTDNKFTKEVTLLSAQTHLTPLGEKVNPKVKLDANRNLVPNPKYDPTKVDKTDVTKIGGILHYCLPVNGFVNIQDVLDTYKHLKSLKIGKFLQTDIFKALFPEPAYVMAAMKQTYGSDGNRFGTWMAKNGLLDKRFSIIPGHSPNPSRGLGQGLVKDDIKDIFKEFPMICYGMFTRATDGGSNTLASIDTPNYFASYGLFKEVLIDNTVYLTGHVQAKAQQGSTTLAVDECVTHYNVLEEMVKRYAKIEKQNPKFGAYLGMGGHNVALYYSCINSHATNGKNFTLLLVEDRGKVFVRSFYSTTEVKENAFGGKFDFCMDEYGSGNNLVSYWNDDHKVTHIEKNGVEYLLYANTLLGMPEPFASSPVYRNDPDWVDYIKNTAGPVVMSISNSSSLIGKYSPNSGNVYDVLVAKGNNISNAHSFNLISFQPSDRGNPYFNSASTAPVVKGNHPEVENNEAKLVWEAEKHKNNLTFYKDDKHKAPSPNSLRSSDMNTASIPTHYRDISLKTTNSLENKALHNFPKKTSLDEAQKIVENKLSNLSPTDPNRAALEQSLKDIQLAQRQRYIDTAKKTNNSHTLATPAEKTLPWGTDSDVNYILNSVMLNTQTRKHVLNPSIHYDPRLHPMFNDMLQKLVQYKITIKDKQQFFIDARNKEDAAGTLNATKESRYDRAIDYLKNVLRHSVEKFSEKLVEYQDSTALDLAIGNPELITKLEHNYETDLFHTMPHMPRVASGRGIALYNIISVIRKFMV
jgi:hypothetical protein